MFLLVVVKTAARKCKNRGLIPACERVCRPQTLLVILPNDGIEVLTGLLCASGGSGKAKCWLFPHQLCKKVPVVGWSGCHSSAGVPTILL